MKGRFSKSVQASGAPRSRWDERTAGEYERVSQPRLGVRSAGETHQEALRDQQVGVSVAPERQTVGQFLQAWLTDVAKQNVRPSTWASYSWVISKHLVPSLGRIQITKLSPQHLQRFLNDRLGSVRCPHCDQWLMPTQFYKHLATAMRQSREDEDAETPNSANGSAYSCDAQGRSRTG